MKIIEITGTAMVIVGLVLAVTVADGSLYEVEMRFLGCAIFIIGTLLTVSAGWKAEKDEEDARRNDMD